MNNNNTYNFVIEKDFPIPPKNWNLMKVETQKRWVEENKHLQTNVNWEKLTFKNETTFQIN